MRRIAIVGALASIGAALILAAPAQAHVAFCKETVNPHGQNVPPADRPRCPVQRAASTMTASMRSEPTAHAVILMDTDGNVFGVFPSGTKVKYTEANGAEPSVKKIGSENGQAGAVDFHITGTGDLVVVAAEEPVTCPVPPPPK